MQNSKKVPLNCFYCHPPLSCLTGRGRDLEAEVKHSSGKVTEYKDSESAGGPGGGAAVRKPEGHSEVGLRHRTALFPAQPATGEAVRHTSYRHKQFHGTSQFSQFCSPRSKHLLRGEPPSANCSSHCECTIEMLLHLTHNKYVAE